MTKCIGWLLLGASLLAGSAAAAPANDCRRPPAIAFHRGTQAAVVSGGVIRAESVCYALSARAGQTLALQVNSPDRNVVVTVYQPGYRVTPASDGPDFSGRTLPGAADEDGATRVATRLPVAGRYLLVLGTSRGGGGEYRMQVGVR